MVLSVASRIARPRYSFARSGRGLFLALSVAPKVGVPPFTWPRGVPVFDTRKSKLSPGPYPPSVPSWHLRCTMVARVGRGPTTWRYAIASATTHRLALAARRTDFTGALPKTGTPPFAWSRGVPLRETPSTS